MLNVFLYVIHGPKTGRGGCCYFYLTDEQLWGTKLFQNSQSHRASEQPN